MKRIREFSGGSARASLFTNTAERGANRPEPDDKERAAAFEEFCKLAKTLMSMLSDALGDTKNQRGSAAPSRIVGDGGAWQNDLESFSRKPKTDAELVAFKESLSGSEPLPLPPLVQ
jgi:hypothetical protein